MLETTVVTWVGDMLNVRCNRFPTSATAKRFHGCESGRTQGIGQPEAGAFEVEEKLAIFGNPGAGEERSHTMKSA
jgi:hypothetical protein